MPKKPQHMGYRELQAKLAAAPALRSVLKDRTERMQGLSEAAQFAQSAGAFKLTLKPKETPMSDTADKDLSLFTHVCDVDERSRVRIEDDDEGLQITCDDDSGEEVVSVVLRYEGEAALCEFLNRRKEAAVSNTKEFNRGRAPLRTGSELEPITLRVAFKLNIDEIIRCGTSYNWWGPWKCEEVFGRLSPTQACLEKRYTIVEQEDCTPWDDDCGIPWKNEPKPPPGVPLDFHRGIALMLEESPQDLAKLIDECPDDADVNDRFLQYSAFGEIKYA